MPKYVVLLDGLPLADALGTATVLTEDEAVERMARAMFSGNPDDWGEMLHEHKRRKARRLLAALHQEADEAERNESCCQRCGGVNPRWVAPSPLWNAVIRGGSINGLESHSFVCPTCFAVMAEEQGIACDWRLTAQQTDAELELVTPSGRRWNAEKWRWEEADRG